MPDYNSSHTGQEVDASVDKTQSLPAVGDVFSGGFFFYEDLATRTAPLVVGPGAGFISITNDTLGPFTNIDHKPSTVTKVWDSVTNKFDFSELKAGDMVDIRYDFNITTTTNNQDIEVDLFLGLNESVVLPIDIETIKSPGTHEISRYIGYFMDANSIANPATIKVNSPDGYSVITKDFYVKIIHRGL